MWMVDLKSLIPKAVLLLDVRKWIIFPHILVAFLCEKQVVLSRAGSVDFLTIPRIGEIEKDQQPQDTWFQWRNLRLIQ